MQVKGRRACNIYMWLTGLHCPWGSFGNTILVPMRCVGSWSLDFHFVGRGSSLPPRRPFRDVHANLKGWIRHELASVPKTLRRSLRPNQIVSDDWPGKTNHRTRNFKSPLVRYGDRVTVSIRFVLDRKLVLETGRLEQTVWWGWHTHR